MACIDQDFIDDILYVKGYNHVFAYTTDIKVLPFRFITDDLKNMIDLSPCCHNYPKEIKPCYTRSKWLCYKEQIVVNEIYDIKDSSQCYEEIKDIMRGKYEWETLQPKDNPDKSFRDDNKPQAVLVGADNEENTLTKLYRQTLNKKTEAQIHHCQTDNSCKKMRKYLRDFMNEHKGRWVGGITW